ncbi:MAG: 3-methyl-2-oxobutanoate hydroxymethyltransferase [Rickettsiales bacterium]
MHFVPVLGVLQETGAAAVKTGYGGTEMADTITYLVECAIPVMAHIGLKPQHVNIMGGYRYQGRTDDERDKSLRDAKAVEKAGAFALLIEGVDAKTAADVTKKSKVPTIGIGAGLDCDGQVLVTEDMSGLFTSTPKFVRTFGNLRGELERAAKDYAKAVRGKKFPGKDESYGN